MATGRWAMIGVLGVLCIALSAPGAIVEQVISREHPSFDPMTASMTVGRDGMVYLTNAATPGFLMRLDREGRGKFTGAVVYATQNATAAADGTVAVASAHFAHKVTIYDRSLRALGEVNDFLVSDEKGWDAPGHVEAGASGDFYGLDQHRDRIVRLNRAANVVGVYAIPRVPAGNGGQVEDFRVDEGGERFYLLTRSGELRCVGFNGAALWAQRIEGPFDVDLAGTVCTVDREGRRLRRWTRDGQPAGQRALRGDEPAGNGAPAAVGLRLYGDDLLIRRKHPTELFRRYSLATGQLKQVVAMEHERLTVDFGPQVWIAGESAPVTIRHEANGQLSRPRWRIWARPLEAPQYRELALTEGKVQAPADMAGLCLVKVSADVAPALGSERSDYLAQTIIEVRRKGAKGAVAVMTPQNRLYYRAGEAISFSLVRKGGEAAAPLLVRLTQGDRVLMEGQVAFAAGQKSLTLSLPAAMTASLVSGWYQLTASGAELTSIPQFLRLGPGTADDAFFRVAYGDYRATYPTAEAWNAAEVVAIHAARIRRLGFNLMVDRLGDPLQGPAMNWGAEDRERLALLARRLEQDAEAAPAEKVAIAPPLLQAMGAYGGIGARQMAILMSNDAGLPLGTGFDKRTPQQLTETIGRVTGTMRPYEAFRGWSWSSNWWVFDQRGSRAARSDEEKVAYEAALKQARETGKWDAVLDRVSRARLALAPEAQERFNAVLRFVGPQLVTASAAPFRNVEAWPPVTFRNVDEVDLQAQWEQIAVPYHAPFNIDFYRRPGKRAWGHPEVWNDAGTGDQIVPTLFMMAMRGADGVGSSGLPPWWPCPEDPRTASNGIASVFRATNEVLRAYGPWMRSLEPQDRMAIVASRRMFVIDDWDAGVMGRHFARVFEAYISCLHAHRPARIVFTDDLTTESLKAFKAVLVVDQRVEMEPALVEALGQAKAAGVAVLYDGTCRPEVVGAFQPLGISFDKVEKDPSQAGDDYAYVRFRDYARANLPALTAALAKVAPVASVDSDELLLTEKVAEQGRFIFVANHSMLSVDPGMLWRMTLYVTSRLPMRANLSLNEPAKAVYDVFAMSSAKPAATTRPAGAGGAQSLSLDLRTMPIRVVAVLPAPIQSVAVRGPANVKAGEPIGWSVQVLDGAGKPIASSVPARLRLLGADGAVYAERFLAVTSQGASGTLPTPINAVAGGLALEATELFSGKASVLNIAVTGSAPAAAFAGEGAVAWPVAATQPARAMGKAGAGSVAAAEQRFGPHIRDMVLTADGALAVLNTMNWDDNVYAVDVATGHGRWRQRFGDYFTFSPMPMHGAFAVAAFDFHSTEGYHLYVANADGQAIRRFALYGLPGRLPHRFVPGLVRDANVSFAVARDSSWVASAGNLGLAVWSRDGKLLWSQDWWKQRRRSAMLATVDPATLLAVSGTTAAAYRTSTGQLVWQVELGTSGEPKLVRVSDNSSTCAILSSAEGGRLYVLRGGKLAATFPTGGSEISLSADGSLIALTEGDRLKVFSATEGLQWVFSGDDTLHNPRVSADGKRIVVGSELGTVYVLDATGKVLHERDAGALAVGAWLNDGDLLVGTWMGTLMRLGADYRVKWQTMLNPSVKDLRRRLFVEETAPTSRMNQWGNAEPKAAAIAPNLLAEAKMAISFVPSGDWGGRASFVHDPAMLRDGRPDAPPTPWLDWSKVGFFAETSPVNTILLDAGDERLRVKGITFFEDPAHPESFLRDATLEYWDAARRQWIAAGTLLSDAAVHTHMLPQPVESSRLRIVLPWGVVGNLRLGEIVLHGEVVRDN